MFDIKETIVKYVDNVKCYTGGYSGENRTFITWKNYKNIKSLLFPNWNLIRRASISEGQVKNVPYNDTSKLKNSGALVRQGTITTERPPLVGEVSANFSE
jgi:hypothetical protein